MISIWWICDSSLTEYFLPVLPQPDITLLLINCENIPDPVPGDRHGDHGEGHGHDLFPLPDVPDQHEGVYRQGRVLAKEDIEKNRWLGQEHWRHLKMVGWRFGDILTKLPSWDLVENIRVCSTWNIIKLILKHRIPINSLVMPDYYWLEYEYQVCNIKRAIKTHLSQNLKLKCRKCLTLSLG